MLTRVFFGGDFQRLLHLDRGPRHWLLRVVLDRKCLRNGRWALCSQYSTFLLLIVILQNDVLVLAGNVDCIEHGCALGGPSLLPIEMNAVVVLVALVIECRVVRVVQRVVLSHILSSCSR